MPVLKNKRRELFCQGMVQNLTKTQAAMNAGFSAKSAESGSRSEDVGTERLGPQVQEF